METTNKLFYSGTKFFTENEEDYRITVRISLDDDCKNNICDWSITADVDWKNKHGKYEDYLGGCCHDEVVKHFPELAKFISLHLCNHQSYCCDHCVNHWGIGLCGCGSGQKVGKCECGSQKAHDILGVKYDSFGVILKNFG